MKQDFIYWLSQELAARGMSQNELARRADISRPLITRALNGDMPVSADTCIKIAAVFDMPPVDLLALAGILPDNTSQNSIADPVVKAITDIAADLPPAQREKLLVFARFLKQGGG